MKMRYLIGIIFLSITINCSEKTVDIKCLKNNAKDSKELNHIFLKKDTLHIVAGCDLLYNPFGQFKSFVDFKKSYPNLLNYKIELFHSYNDSDNDMDTLYKIMVKDSYIKFINVDYTEDEDYSKNRMMLVSAKIDNPEIEFLTGIKVGITQKQFVEKFFNKNCFLGKVRVIEMESVLTGMWHYYCFDNGLLKEINIKTDF